MSKKLPFHQIHLLELLEAASTIRNGPYDAETVRLARISLTYLKDGKMPATIAHAIVKEHGELTELFYDAGFGDLADLALETFEDLRGREDENENRLSDFQLKIPATGISLEEIEIRVILEALKMSHWAQKDAAELLSISPRVINYKIKTLRIAELVRRGRQSERGSAPQR